MSKGLGKWERIILSAVETSGAAWLGAVVDAVEPTLSARQSAGRAATSLERKGLISTWNYKWGDRGWYRTLVGRPDETPEGRPYGYIPALNANGTPELVEAFKAEVINGRDASLFAGLPADQQKMIDYSDKEQVRAARRRALGLD